MTVMRWEMMEESRFDWQALCEMQAVTIEQLSELCETVIQELSQYKSIDQEEDRLKTILKGEKI